MIETKKYKDVITLWCTHDCSKSNYKCAIEYHKNGNRTSDKLVIDKLKTSNIFVSNFLIPTSPDYYNSMIDFKNETQCSLYDIENGKKFLWCGI